jgi:hypothetical protein
VNRNREELHRNIEHLRNTTFRVVANALRLIGKLTTRQRRAISAGIVVAETSRVPP